MTTTTIAHNPIERLVFAFWGEMRSTGETGTCPKCGQRGLTVRARRYRGRVWRYVNHCHSVQPVSWH